MRVLGGNCGRRLEPAPYCLSAAAVALLLLLLSAAHAETPAFDPGSSSGTQEGGGRIEAVDSDYLFLEMRPSTLPGIQGYGVFAKADIPHGEILCEMRGPIVPNEAPINSDKLYEISSITRKGLLKIIADNICAYINDCIDLSKVNYTRLDNGVYVYEMSPPPFDGFQYNALDITTKLGKVFVHSVMNISAGSELCFFYGWSYWGPRLP